MKCGVITHSAKQDNKKNSGVGTRGNRQDETGQNLKMDGRQGRGS